MPLILAFVLFGLFGAAVNYVTSRWAPLALARIVFVLSIVSMMGVLIFCAVALGLAIETDEMRYFGVDTVFGGALFATLVWVPSVSVGARMGRANQEQ